MARSTRDRSPKVHQVEELPLDKLLLDPENPRFGGSVGAKTPQEQIVDTIVEKFGVDDLLSSLSMNGFFGSEPLVGYRARGSDEVTIAEGNRRLAACLVLEEDPRAAKHEERAKKYNIPDRPKIEKVPVLLYDDRKELLAFMGVRHIAAQNPWDSYAKAHWVADMLKQNEFTLDQIVGMIGDQYNTVRRMLDGYYFVGQMKASGKWDPADSMRAGRGSNPEFPFSWVYTALATRSLRDYLGLSDEIKPDPIPANSIEKASEFLTFMFGNKTRSINPAISDSREIGDLAAAVSEVKQLGALRSGQPLSRAIIEGKEPSSRVEQGLYAAVDSLKDVNGVLTANTITQLQAQRVQPLSAESRKLAVSVHKRIADIISGESEESDA
jgi:hypothetical protein